MLTKIKNFFGLIVFIFNLILIGAGLKHDNELVRKRKEGAK